MIGLLLVAQLAAIQPAPPAPLAPGVPTIIAKRHFAPLKGCPWSGRMEASFEPAALYRKGDRDPKVLRRWVDFPEGQWCLAGGAP